jgi:hypothetical protein
MHFRVTKEGTVPFGRFPLISLFLQAEVSVSGEGSRAVGEIRSVVFEVADDGNPGGICDNGGFLELEAGGGGEPGD